MNLGKIKAPSSALSKKPRRSLPDKPGGLANAASSLAELRLALLDLHKALIASERADFEKTVGSIQSPNHLLQLLIRDPRFAWLQPLSQLIVAMDETLDGKEPLTIDGIDALVKQTRLLLIASESGEGFSKHYFDALQREPDVVLAHATAAKLFRSRNRMSRN
jgi:hypothetical protein